jgi:hypothetical protein
MSIDTEEVVGSNPIVPTISHSKSVDYRMDLFFLRSLWVLSRDTVFFYCAHPQSGINRFPERRRKPKVSALAVLVADQASRGDQCLERICIAVRARAIFNADKAPPYSGSSYSEHLLPARRQTPNGNDTSFVKAQNCFCVGKLQRGIGAAAGRVPGTAVYRTPCGEAVTARF